MLLSEPELREIRCSESHVLLKGVYEAVPSIYTVFSELGNIVYRGWPQMIIECWRFS